MLEMSCITAILQLYSKVTDLFGNVIVKRMNIRLFYFIGTISLHIESPSYLYFLVNYANIIFSIVMRKGDG